MSRLFLDNNNTGKVSYYSQRVYVPASLRVLVSTPNGGMSSLNNTIPIFVQSITADRNMQLQVKQSLSGKFYALPFGEGPGSLSITAIACTASQADLATQQRTYRRLVDMGAPPEQPKETTVFNSWQGLLVSALSPTKSPTTYASVPSTVTPTYPVELTPMEMDDARANSKSQELEAMSAALEAEKQVWADELSTVPSPPTVTRSTTTSTETPLSFQQVNAVFSRMAYLARIGGIKDKRPILEVTTGGVVYRGRLTGLKSSSLPENAGFQFTLQFILLDEILYPSEVMTANVAHTYDVDIPGFSTTARTEGGFVTRLADPAEEAERQRILSWHARNFGPGS